MTIFCDDREYDSLEQVDETHTDVVAIEVVEGGWLVFTDARDWAIWKGQD